MSSNSRSTSILTFKNENFYRSTTRTVGGGGGQGKWGGLAREGGGMLRNKEVLPVPIGLSRQLLPRRFTSRQPTVRLWCGLRQVGF